MVKFRHAHAVLGFCILAGRCAKVPHNDTERGLAASDFRLINFWAKPLAPDNGLGWHDAGSGASGYLPMLQTPHCGAPAAYIMSAA